MNAITKALADTERSYFACKAAASMSADKLMAASPTGTPLSDPQRFPNAKSQLQAFRSWVFAAIRPIANRIAAQPIKVGRKGRPRGLKQAADLQEIEDHPITKLIANPNDLMTGWGLVWATVASINLCGRAYWWLPENEEAIYLIPCSWIVDFTGSTSFKSWKVQPPGNGEQMEIPSERVVYFALPSPSDPWGVVSPLQAAADAVNSDDDILRSQRSAFRKGIMPSHALIVGKQPNPDVPGGLRPHLTDAQQRQIIGAINRRYQGTDQHGTVLILDGLIEDVKRLSNTPAEMDWTESAEAMKDRILQAFGVSPYVIGSSEPGSRAASATAEKHLIAAVVNPLIRCMSEALTEWLAPIYGEDVTVWIEPAVADDPEMAIQWATLLAGNGSLTVHELRRLAPFSLPEERAFDGQLVGGTNMETTSPIERGIRGIMKSELATLGSDYVMDQLHGRNGHGRR